MITITKQFTFEAAHKLPYHSGVCRNLHGHHFILEIEVSGPIIQNGPETGMIMDFSNLKSIVKNKIIDKLDHHYLNDKFANPTSEVIVNWMTNELSVELPGLYRVRLYETPTSYAEWKKYGFK